MQALYQLSYTPILAFDYDSNNLQGLPLYHFFRIVFSQFQKPKSSNHFPQVLEELSTASATLYQLSYTPTREKEGNFCAKSLITSMLFLEFTRELFRKQLTFLGSYARIRVKCFLTGRNHEF